MAINIEALEFVKLLTTNATDANFASKVPTATEPTGAGALDLPRGGGGQVRENLLLLFFGVGADNTTFDARVIGWRKVSTLWMPVTLCEVSCTLSAVVGVAGQPVVDTERFADTITVNKGLGAVYTPTADAQAAMLLVASEGCAKVEVIFDMTGATSGNALLSMN